MSNPNQDHPIDQFLRHAAGDPTPTPADRDVSERALKRAISEAGRQRTQQRLPRRWKMSALVGSLAVILVAVIVVQIGQPSAASTTLVEIAEAAKLIDPLNIPDGSYAYTISEGTVRGVLPSDAIDGRTSPLTYLLPKTREVWVGTQGTVQIRTTTHTPEFFAPEDEIDYYSAGLDKIDQIDETVTLTGTGVTSLLDERDWPTAPHDLEVAIIDSLPADLAEPRNVAVADLVLKLVTETAATPDLKAAALMLVAGLEGIHLDDRLPDGGGTFSITNDQPRPTRLTFAIDGSGNVLRITSTDLDGDPTNGIPPNTLIDATSYEPTVIVNDLGSP